MDSVDAFIVFKWCWNFILYKTVTVYKTSHYNLVSTINKLVQIFLSCYIIYF